MKPFAILIFLSLISCNKDSSPEGRMQIRYDQLKLKIDSLADQNKAILDSLVVINQKLKVLRSE